jgi:UDP-N-acetylmuramoyl-tripeptide--D-alanyl-D-alanine ligase
MQDSGRNILADIVGRLGAMRIKGVSIDSRTIKEGELFVALRGDRFDGHDFVSDAIRRGAWGALVERSALESKYPTLSALKNIYPVEDTLLSLQEMSLMHRRNFDLPVIAVTGSNGKTTTKEMLASILAQRGPVLKNEGNLNNHIGVPLTLLRLGPSHKTAIIEMGMSNLGEIEALTRLAMPDVGVITNIGPAHLEFLGSTDAVAQAKGELLAGMRPDGTAVLNADDPYFDALRAKCQGQVLSFGIEKQADVRATDIRMEKDLTDCRIAALGGNVPVRLRTVGRHNVYNALAAAAAALAVDVPIETVKFGLEAFQPVAMRSELKERKGVTILADCYNANPGSMKAALETLASLRRGRKNLIAVLGDMLELGAAGPDAHRAVGAAAARLGVDLLIALGASKHHIADGALQAGMGRERVFEADSASRAASLLRERAKPGDTVLIKGSRGMKMEKILEEF